MKKKNERNDCNSHARARVFVRTHSTLKTDKYVSRVNFDTPNMKAIDTQQKKIRHTQNKRRKKNYRTIRVIRNYKKYSNFHITKL